MNRCRGFFIVLLFISVVIGRSTYGQQENEAYWADASSDTRIDQLALLVDEEQVIRLKAEVPAGKTLKAYNIALTYDVAKVSVEEVGASPGSSFPPTNINHNTPGTIIINGFDVTGLTGPAVVSFIDVTMKGLAPDCFNFVITVNSFGASSSDRFKPTTDALEVMVQ